MYVLLRTLTIVPKVLSKFPGLNVPVLFALVPDTVVGDPTLRELRELFVLKFTLGTPLVSAIVIVLAEEFNEIALGTYIDELSIVQPPILPPAAVTSPEKVPPAATNVPVNEPFAASNVPLNPPFPDEST